MAFDPPTTRVSLILRLRNPADADAWEEFVSIYHPLLWSVAKRLSLNDTDAADACQGAMLRLTQVVDQWSPDLENSNFRGWLFRVAHNCMLRQFSKNKARTVSAVDEEGNSFLDQLAGNPDDQNSVYQIEFRRQLFALAVENVRPTVTDLYWQAFWMTYIENDSIKSVAEKLNTTVSSIYVSRHRVLNRIREETMRLSKTEWGGLPEVNQLVTDSQTEIPTPKNEDEIN